MSTSSASLQEIRIEPALPPLRAETISGYQEFLDLEPVWNSLVEATVDGCPFLEHAWVRSWWECFGRGSELHIILVKSGDRPIAIAPLMLTTVRMWGIKVRKLGFLYNDHVPRADFLVAERSEEVYRAIWNHISRDRCWDMLQLCQLVEGCQALAQLPRLAAADGCRSGMWESLASPFVSLDSSWNEYFQGLATKHRSNLRNRFKRIEAIGKLEVETVTENLGLTDALETGFRLEAAAWKGENHTAIACDADIARFYMLFARRAVERGWLRLNFLRVGDSRVAFDYTLSYKNRLHLVKIGYDPEYSKFSPYNLLLCRILERAFGNGIAEYDFLGATADWKTCWAKHARQYHWLFVFAGSFKGRLLHAIKFRLIPLVKRALRRIQEALRRPLAHDRGSVGGDKGPLPGGRARQRDASVTGGGAGAVGGGGASAVSDGAAGAVSGGKGTLPGGRARQRDGSVTVGKDAKE